MNNTYANAFVLYESVFKQFEALKNHNPETALLFIEAIMNFGLFGTKPDEASELWLYGIDNIFASIEAAKNRRTQNQVNGSKGGRPRINIDQEELRRLVVDEGMTNRQLADYFKCDEKTIRNRIQEWQIG